MSESSKILRPDQPFAAIPHTEAPGESLERSKPVSSFVSADETLCTLLRVIVENGADPVSQFSGFLITDDPAYLPDADDARALARRIGRDKLLEALIQAYLTSRGIEP